jgi:anti-sigma-K factor RskA
MSSEHDRWEELAAGHALNALEPEETEAFTAHLAGCERCRRVLADHDFVASQLGTLVDDQEDAPSWQRIRAGVLPDVPVSLAEERARRRPPRLVAVAASVVLLLAAGVAALLLTDRSRSSQEQVLASCAASTSCHVVHLQGKADVVVTEDTVRLLPKALGAPPAGRVFVLWQLPRAGRPTMIGTLGSTDDGSVGEAHRLALPYDSTAAFGVSAEPASVVPTGPTDVVALGQT